MNQDGQRQQYLPQESYRHPDKGYKTSRSSPPEDVSDYESDLEMYGSDRRNDGYRKEDSYYKMERNDYRAPGPGFKVPSGRDEYNGSRGVEVAVRPSANKTYMFS